MVPGIAEIAARTPPLHVLPAPFGFFPDANRPRVVYAGVLATDELVHVAREIDVSTSSAGIKRDPRPYCPHITIGRMIQSAARFPRAAGGIDGASKAQLHGFTLPGPLFEPFWATSLVLMRNTSAAERVAQPARYTVVRAFELKEV
jgi:2'-5' RNA ligase